LGVSVTVNILVFRLLLALVLLAPLPLGANRPWAWSLLALSLGGLVGVWSLMVLAGRCRAPAPVVRLTPVVVLFGLTLAWAALQATGLPPAAWWHPLWAETTAALGLGKPFGAVSIDPERTLTAIMRLTSYGLVFWLSVQLGRDRSRAHEALAAVAIAGLIYAVYGLTMHFAGWERILWLEKWAYTGDLTATFVNRNAFGAYAGLGMICCIALFLRALRPSRPGEQRRISEVTETVLVQATPYLIAALVLATALLLSHSRGAFLCAGLGLMVLMMAMVAGGVIRLRSGLLLAGVILAVGGGVMAMSGEVTVKRLSETNAAGTDEGRTNAWRLVRSAIMDAPWTGNGLGAFQPAFRMYRDASLSEKGEWEYAHDVHLETAMDLGLPATATLYGAFGVILAACVRGLFRRRRDQVYPAVALAAAALLAAHGVVDFSVQMPAIAVTLALLLGLGYAHSWSSRDDDAPKHRSRPGS
jgi:O-antigen ligase